MQLDSVRARGRRECADGGLSGARGRDVLGGWGVDLLAMPWILGDDSRLCRIHVYNDDFDQHRNSSIIIGRLGPGLFGNRHFFRADT